MGINQIDPDNDFGGSSRLIIAFNVDYLFDANGFGPWVQFAVIPLVSFIGASDVVTFHLDATFTDVTDIFAPVVLGPGLLIDFERDGPGGDPTGLLFNTLGQVSPVQLPILGGSTVNISGSIVFTADDPDLFASIFTTIDAGLNVPAAEPGPTMLVLLGMAGLWFARRAAPRSLPL